MKFRLLKSKYYFCAILQTFFFSLEESNEQTFKYRYFVDFREKMGKIGSNVKEKLEETKQSKTECPKQSLKEENACIAIIFNDRVENNNNDTNKDKNNSDNNVMKKKGKTSIGKINIKSFFFAFIL